MMTVHIPYAPVARRRWVSMTLPLVIACSPGRVPASTEAPQIVVASPQAAPLPPQEAPRSDVGQAGSQTGYAMPEYPASYTLRCKAR